MARFVSQYKAYRHGIRSGRASYLGPQGDMVPPVRELVAEFSHSLVSDRDVEVAKTQLNNPDPLKSDFRGTVENEAGRDIDIAHRLSVYDSEFHKLNAGLTDDEEQFIVEKLRSSQHNGRTRAFIEVIAQPADKPWANYDELDSAEKILEVAEIAGADLALVAKYEAENRNRSDVLDALKQGVKAEEDAVVVQA